MVQVATMKKNIATFVVRVATAAVVTIPAVQAVAQDAAPRAFDVEHLGWGLLSTVAYGLVGIVLVMVGYKAFAWMLPFSVKKELEEDHNLSVGVLLAALVLGICLVMAATIHS